MEFAIKKNDLKKETIPWEINKEGSYGALVIRYWGCSLSCAICYSQSYAYLNEEGSRKKVNLTLNNCEESIKKLTTKVGWTRIQGGEPLLNRDRAIFTTKLCAFALKYMEDNSPYEDPRVIIQTNGLWLGNTTEEELSNFFNKLIDAVEQTSKGRIIIELSFKGANKFVIKKFGDTLNQHSDILLLQKKAFFVMKKNFEHTIWNITKRIAFYPVGGFGPQLNNPGFIPIDIKDGEEYPLFHPSTWDDDFKEVFEEFIKLMSNNKLIYRDYLEKHSKRIPLECMEPSFFQKGWTSQIKKREILKKFISKNIKINPNPQLKIFNRELLGLNIPEANSVLISKIKDLKEKFYEAEPSDHYPYL